MFAAYSGTELHVAGYSPSELKNAGYTASEIYVYSMTVLRTLFIEQATERPLISKSNVPFAQAAEKGGAGPGSPSYGQGGPLLGSVGRSGDLGDSSAVVL